MRLIIFGPPGVGKGTQAQILSQEYDVPHISTGDILRASIRDGTELGNKAKSYSDKGELVPDDVMVGIIREVLSSDKCGRGFILDGFPRTVAQAEALSNIFIDLHVSLDGVINVEVNDSVLVYRLTLRRQCKICGSVFNVAVDKLEGNDCPACRSVGTIYQRDDDKEDTIKNRLRVYSQSTLPVKEYYRAKGLLADIDGVGDIEAIHQRILNALNK
jgi:adenylate kinase